MQSRGIQKPVSFDISFELTNLDRAALWKIGEKARAVIATNTDPIGCIGFDVAGGVSRCFHHRQLAPR